MQIVKNTTILFDRILYNHIGWQEPNNVKKCTLKPKISYLQKK